MPDRSVVNFYLTGSGDCPPVIKEEDKGQGGIYLVYKKASENLPETTEE